MTEEKLQDQPDPQADLDLDDILGAAEAIAREAGLSTLAAYRQDLGFELKGETDPVTVTDLASEKLIRRRLAGRFPDHLILAEEGGGDELAGDHPRWLVDPLDGTVNFCHGHPFYSISIALEHKARIVAGVVHAPVMALTWKARLGGGATRNGAPIQVSHRDRFGEALCASGFPYDKWSNPDDNLAEWTAVTKRCQGVRRCGSAAIDLCLIADGTYDGYWEKRLNPWDLAAGSLIVAEAGGRIESLEGDRLPPWPETVVASNGRVHDELVEILVGARTK